MKRRAAIERARRQQWALITGRALSWADFAGLTGKTPQEVFKINHRLHAVGLTQSMRQTARPARLQRRRRR
jgi:hypothetical protein